MEFIWSCNQNVETSSGYGQVGQAPLLLDLTNTLEWATPTAGQAKPGPFTWKFEKEHLAQHRQDTCGGKTASFICPQQQLKA